MILDGYVRGVKVILDEDKDCESHIINQSRATPQLQRLATNICGF
jgi:DNA-binding FrmR family transcriptional regulator